MLSQEPALVIKKNFSMPRLFLHIEGFVILVGSLILYARLDFSWSVFLLLLFVPDLPLFFYGLDRRLASITYNIAHSITLPLIMLLISNIYSYQTGIQMALIWLAHIGLDHVFGYGLKYLGEMKETHFSRV